MNSQQEGQLWTSIIGQKLPEASRSRFKIQEPGKGLKTSFVTLHLFQMRLTPSSPNLSRWRPKQHTILTHSQHCRSMCPSFHSRWWTTSTRWSDQWTSKDGRMQPASIIKTTQRSRTFGVYLKKPQRRPLQREASRRCRPSYWLESWESRCRLQTQTQWTCVLIGPDPIIGNRELKDAQPTPKMRQQNGARRCNATIATKMAISHGYAPRRMMTKERSQ